MKIVVLDGYSVVHDDLGWDSLGRLGHLTCYDRTSRDQIIPRISDADIILTSKCIIDKYVLDRASCLKYIGVIATGYNNVDIDLARSMGITVTNIPSYSTDSVAQFTFALILEIVNQVGIHNRSVHQGDWSKSDDFCYVLTPQVELSGKTIGIIGYGSIGKRVASLAQAFGMKVLVNSSHSEEHTDEKDIVFVNMNELLKESDVVSLHCALTKTNREIINRNSLSMMKDGAILINTARGPLINIDDLADSLKSGKLEAAAIDVLPEEPPSEDNVLTDLDNCIITPHIAWITRESRKRLIGIATHNVDMFIKRAPVNIVG